MVNTPSGSFLSNSLQRSDLLQSKVHMNDAHLLETMTTSEKWFYSSQGVGQLSTAKLYFLSYGRERRNLIAVSHILNEHAEVGLGNLLKLHLMGTRGCTLELFKSRCGKLQEALTLSVRTIIKQNKLSLGLVMAQSVDVFKTTQIPLSQKTHITVVVYVRVVCIFNGFVCECERFFKLSKLFE